ncbi:sensor histidine kinase [Flammeovirga aprica]|uniref:histidine kinase n=1 Tax=Flammeovirga aprica JL-4 TaxID=694437 RepID=A0A7X9XCR3_9BACT|nr:ATP-binding protein [Flammeovirga aprica]NME71909.1 GHKL domain-containing protein [Flammeovirga aprica JL-4]
MKPSYNTSLLLDHLNTAIYVLRLKSNESLNFDIIYANSVNKEVIGTDLRKFVGTDFKTSFPELFETKLPLLYYTSLREQRIINVGEVEYGDCQVSKNTFIIKAIPLSHQEVMVTYNNISRLKKAERELIKNNLTLKEKNRSLEEFAYITSHDLQEPLNTITSFVEIFKDRYDGQLDETGQMCLSYLENSATRMSDMIKGILHHSRLGTNVTITEVDLNETMQGIVEDLRTMIADKKAVIQSDPLPKLKGCDVGLRLLFQNLIENALKYQREDNQPEVIIKVEPQDNGWLFSVKDNGIGIREEHQKKIFQVFQRLHDDQSSYKGTGLGLSNCMKIVKVSGGKLWVDSTYGKGSTFFFNLPKL